MKKRICSFFLVMCLIFSQLPVVSFAVETADSDTIFNSVNWTQEYDETFGNVPVSLYSEAAQAEGTAITALSVGGVNALRTPSGNGWSFDAATATLTLNNASITTSGAVEGIVCTGDLRIVLKGSSTIKNTVASGLNGNQMAPTVVVEGNLTIEGETGSKLTTHTPFSFIQNGGYSIYAAGGDLTLANCTIDANSSIVSDGKLTVSNCVIVQDTLTSRSEDPLYVGLGGTTALTVENSNITISNAYQGLFETNGNTRITDSVINTNGCYMGIAVPNNGGGNVYIERSNLNLQGGVYGILLTYASLHLTDCEVITIENSLADLAEFWELNNGELSYAPTALWCKQINIENCSDVTISGTLFNIFSDVTQIKYSDVTAHGGAVGVYGSFYTTDATVSVKNTQEGIDAYVNLTGGVDVHFAAIVGNVAHFYSGSNVTVDGVMYGISCQSNVLAEYCDVEFRGGLHAVMAQEAFRVSGANVSAEVTWSEEERANRGYSDYPAAAIFVANTEADSISFNNAALSEGEIGLYESTVLGEFCTVLDADSEPMLAVQIKDPTQPEVPEPEGQIVRVAGVDARVTTAGEGWSYDAATKTLTLDNANLATQGEVEGIYSEGDLTIVLKGSNAISNASVTTESGNKAAFAIECKGNLKLLGEEGSSLTVRTANSFMFVFGAVHATGNMTIENCNIDANCSLAATGVLSVSDSVIVQDILTSRDTDPLMYGLVGDTGIAVENSDISVRNALYGLAVSSGNVQIKDSEITTEDCYYAVFADLNSTGMSIEGSTLNVQGGAYGVILGNGVLSIADCESITIENSLDDIRDLWERNGQQLEQVPAALFAPDIRMENCPDVNLSGGFISMYCEKATIENCDIAIDGGLAGLMATETVYAYDSVMNVNNAQACEDLSEELMGGLVVPPAAIVTYQGVNFLRCDVIADGTWYGIYSMGKVDMLTSDVFVQGGCYGIAVLNELIVNGGKLDVAAIWSAADFEREGMAADSSVIALLIGNNGEGECTLEKAVLIEGEIALYEPADGSSFYTAVDADGEPLSSVQIIDPDRILPSGTLGDNLTWSLDENGTLTIAGEGEMVEIDAETAPWTNYRDRVINVVIEDGVTTISDYAFSFSPCLANVTIGKDVESVSYRAFFSCFELAAFHVDEENACYSNDTSGILYNKEKTVLIMAPRILSGDFIVPQGVATIDDWAFAKCADLTKVTIPDSVTSINESAFYDCTSLAEIRFEGDVPEIVSNAFSDVNATAYYPAGNRTWTSDVMQNYDGNITWVAELLLGDVNSDGLVNAEDRLVLTRYLAKWTDYPESVINMAAADVNCDGKVNAQDRLILTRHLAAWTGYETLGA